MGKSKADSADISFLCCYYRIIPRESDVFWKTVAQYLCDKSGGYTGRHGRLLYICVPYFVCGIMDTMTGVLRGLGYSIMPMIVSLMGACVLRIIWVKTFCQMPQFHHVEYVYMSYIVTWTITATAHIICYTVVMKKKRKQLELEQKMV